MVSVYEAFDWMLPGYFEAFAYRKAFCAHQVRDGIGARHLILGLFLEESGWTNDLEQVGTTRKHGVEFYAVATK
jgi:hypothetical protein